MLLKSLTLPLAFATYAAITPMAHATLTDTIKEVPTGPSQQTIQENCRSRASFYMDNGPFAFARNDGAAPFYNCANSHIVQVPCTDIFMSWTISAFNPNQLMREEFLESMKDHCPKEARQTLLVDIMEIVTKQMIEDLPAVGSFVTNSIAPILHR